MITDKKNVYIVRARATLPDGRVDRSLGAVSLAGLNGEALANAADEGGDQSQTAGCLLSILRSRVCWTKPKRRSNVR